MSDFLRKSLDSISDFLQNKADFISDFLQKSVSLHKTEIL